MRTKDPFAHFPALKQSAFFPMHNALRIIEQRLTDLDKRYGLTIPQIWILIALQNGPASQGLVAECLGVNKNSMVQIVRESVKQGILLKERNPVNEREVLISHAPKGTQILHTIMREQRSLLEDAFFPLNAKEIRQCWDWAIRIIETFHHQK